jgi:flagellin
LPGQQKPPRIFQKEIPMTLSVNTNLGAMAALQNLNATQKDLTTTQNRINTGLNVSSTKDDSAKYTVAQTLRGDLGSLSAVSSSLSTAKSTTDVAIAGGEQISDLLNQMKAKAIEANDSGISADSTAALAKDFDALKSQIGTIISSSTFNGVNLLDGGTGAVSALQSTDTTATPLTVANQDFKSDITGLGTTFTDAASAKTMVANLETASKSVLGKLSTLGSASRQIDGQTTFVSKLSDAITAGVGNIVDADLAKESAKLQALQVKQQLGVQALSIANQAPQTITSLFR